MPRIKTGDVIAVAVDGVKCPPVGIVADVDDGAVLLDLYSWLAQHFTAGRILIRRPDIRATMWAERVGADEDVWDMEPLAVFQDARRSER